MNDAAGLVAAEFFFRGFMLQGLRPSYGHACLWIMLLPYMQLHAARSALEELASFFGGFVLGMIALQTRSILGGCVLQVGVAWTCDVFVLLRTGRLFALPF